MMISALLTVICIFVAGLHAGLLLNDELNNKPVALGDVVYSILGLLLGVYFLISLIGSFAQ